MKYQKDDLVIIKDVPPKMPYKYLWEQAAVTDILNNKYVVRMSDATRWEITEPYLADPADIAEEKQVNYYDDHYKGAVEPIALMQAQMTPEAYKGYLRGNIIKYASRFGKKDAELKEATKIYRYAEWLLKASQKNDAEA